MTGSRTADERRAFIGAETRPHPVPHVPEITLHLADEAMELWSRTEEELGALGVPAPFWAFAWAGGQALARYVLDNASTVAGRRVLDIATGSGLVAIAAARAGAAHVTANDIDPFALEALALNCTLNKVQVTARSGDLLAGGDAGGPVDVILAGDVFYERQTADRMTAWLDARASAGIEVLIGDPGRAYLPRHQLEEMAAYSVPVQRSPRGSGDQEHEGLAVASMMAT